MKHNIIRIMAIITITVTLYCMCGCDINPCTFGNHAWVAANYQTPKTCENCKITDGEPLPADYASKNIIINDIEIGKEYSYTTSCYDDPSKKTTASVYVENYEIAESIEAHTTIVGYEWHVVTIKIYMHDENAQKYGAVPIATYDCYYDMAEVTTTTTDNTYTVNYNGIDYAECMCVEGTGWSEEENGFCITWKAAYHVPIGYDGTIIALYDTEHDYTKYQYYADVLDENALIFRLN